MTVPQIKVKVVRRPQIKVKTLVNFPANVVANKFLTVANSGGTYTLDVNYTLLSPGPIIDPTTAYAAVLDQSSGLYRIVSIASLLVSGLDLDLQAIAALTGVGVLSRTGTNTWALRTITGTANEITVTNGDGVAGNETLSLPASLTFTGKTVTGGTFNSPALVTPALGTPASGVATNLTGTAAGLTAGNATLAATVTTNANMTGDVTSVGNATTIGANKVTRAMEAQGIARSVIGVTGNATANVADIQGTANQFLGVNSAGTALAFGTMSGDATLSGPAITIAANAVTNAKLATMAAWTFKGNATAGSAVPTDVTIAGLTNKASPVAADLLLIWDVAGSAWKNAAVSSIASAGSVSSIAGNTGAFTLNSTSGITNSTNDIILQQATASQFGAVKVDNTSIKATAGVISANGAPVLLNTLTAASSASLSDTTSLTASYNEYELIFENILPATNAVTLELLVHSGGTFKSTGYLTTGIGNSNGGALVTQSGSTFIPLSHATFVSNTAPGVSGRIRVYKPSSSEVHHWLGEFSMWNGTNVAILNVCGIWNTAAAIDGFQVLFSTGNITSGVIKVYGSI